MPVINRNWKRLQFDFCIFKSCIQATLLWKSLSDNLNNTRGDYASSLFPQHTMSPPGELAVSCKSPSSAT